MIEYLARVTNWDANLCEPEGSYPLELFLVPLEKAWEVLEDPNFHVDHLEKYAKAQNCLIWYCLDDPSFLPLGRKPLEQYEFCVVRVERLVHPSKILRCERLSPSEQAKIDKHNWDYIT